MVLGGQLLRAQSVCCGDLSRHVSGVAETKRIKWNLCDHGVIWDHHCHCSEEGFQVVGQLGTASVAGVHCNKDVAGRFEGDVGILKEEDLFALFSGDSDGEDLLGDDWQHFKVDTVELVETWPCTWGGEAFEEFTHGLVIKTVWAIEDDTLSGKCFGEILDSLGFSCTSGSFRSTTIIQVKSTAERSIASVSKWRDNKPGAITKILIVVIERRIDHSDPGIIIFPVISELWLPLELGGFCDIFLDQLPDHVLVVDVEHDQGLNCASV